MASQQKKLQIPVSDQLNKKLKKKSESLGFSSANELVRVLVHNFVNDQILLRFVQPGNYHGKVEQASPELEKRIGEAIRAYQKGEYIKVDPSDDKSFKRALDID